MTGPLSRSFTEVSLDSKEEPAVQLLEGYGFPAWEK